MLPSRVGEKRGRDAGARNEALKFVPGLTLSQHPPNQRKGLFLKKLDDVIIAKSLHHTEFRGYTIRERFEQMGWEQLLNFSCDKIYKRVVIQWVASLSRNGDELTGIVNGKPYTITPVIIRDLLGVDTRTDVPYARFNEADFRTTRDENKRRWREAFKTVFGVVENAKKVNRGFQKSKMTPLVQVLWGIGVWTFHPRLVQVYDTDIYLHEIYLLHALFTGDYLYSFAHLMIDDIWDMYEHEHRRNIPHAYYISEILDRLGAVSEDEYVQVIPLDNRLITRRSFFNLNFSKSDTEYIIDDCVTLQRVTFPRKVREKKAPPQFTEPPFWHSPPQFTQTPFCHSPPQMHAPNPQLDMTPLLTNLQNLVNMQSSQSQKQLSEMMTMITNIQKQRESQALEAERREKQAEIRAHAIIWDMERQRYFYEQEQEQLHKVWNQAYGSDEFQFPQISHISFHPPQAGSRYYDPTQGNEIPKAFQDIFHDIYGTRR